MAAIQTVAADEYVRTINDRDAAGFGALFAEDAVVDDNGRTFRGRAAIEDWAAREIFAFDVTLDVIAKREDAAGATLTTIVDGTFDRTGLPDPLFIDQHVTSRDGRITELTCRLSEAPAAQ
jgi:hypothetical protein